MPSLWPSNSSDLKRNRLRNLGCSRSAPRQDTRHRLLRERSVQDLYSMHKKDKLKQNCVNLELNVHINFLKHRGKVL